MPVEGVRIGSGTGGSAISATRPTDRGVPNNGGDKGKRPDYGAAGQTGNGDGSGASGRSSPQGGHDYTEGVPIAVVQAVLDERKRERDQEVKAGRANEMMVGSWASWASNDDGELYI